MSTPCWSNPYATVYVMIEEYVSWGAKAMHQELMSVCWSGRQMSCGPFYFNYQPPACEIVHVAVETRCCRLLIELGSADILFGLHLIQLGRRLTVVVSSYLRDIVTSNCTCRCRRRCCRWCSGWCWWGWCYTSWCHYPADAGWQMTDCDALRKSDF